MLDGQSLEGCAVSQNTSTHHDYDTPCTTQLSHQGEIMESKRAVAQQQVQPQQPQPTAEASNTDPAVVGRMLELEGAIALVRSSLDNHASSYYSVASQIAELNARISHLGIQDRSIKTDDSASNSVRLHHKPSSNNGDVVDASATVKPRIPSVACGTSVKLDDTGNGREEFGGDEQYTRIQDMVDSLIKDANLALNCKPDDFPCGNDNTTNIRTIDAEYEPGLQISQSSEPDETATLVMDSSSGQRSRFASVSGPTHSMSRPASCGAENLTHAAAYSPSATHGTSPRTPRGRKSRHSAMLPIPSFADDPSEADAESDSVLGSFNTVSDRQSLHRNRPRTSHYRFQRSRRRKALEYPQGQSSRGVWNIERFGSNTTGPLQWNSSETCVSPRISEPPEHQLTPMMTPVCTQSQSLAKSICTPTRESHFDPGSSFSFKGLDKLAPHADLSVRNTQDFPYLASDEQTWRQQGVYASSGFSQDHEDLFFHRGYRPDTRAVLRSASILDERMDADMASLKGDRHCLDYDYVHIREEARARSNTYTTETSLTTAVPADAYTYESLHSSQANSDRREHVPREVSRKANSIGLQPSLSSMSPLHDCAVGRATYRSASSHYMTSIHHENPHATKNIAGFLSSPLVKRGTVNSCMDVLFPDLGDSECRRGDRMVSDSRGRGTGLISMFSLLYWTLLFTLGALMLDSFLCQVAGKHVMGTVDEIAHAETNNLSSPEDTSSSESCEKEDKAEYSIEHGKTSGSTNLANTVGRFVRWYVEEPQHISASNRDYPQTQKEHPRLIRMRKASAIRGSFKHIG